MNINELNPKNANARCAGCGDDPHLVVDFDCYVLCMKCYHRPLYGMVAWVNQQVTDGYLLSIDV